jgi:hypothetical protein
MVAAYDIEVTVADISSTRGRGRRTRLTALAGALAILVVTFFVTSDLPTGLGLFDELYRTHPTLVAYIVAYTCYLGFAVVDIAVVSAQQCRRVAHSARTAARRVCLRVGVSGGARSSVPSTMSASRNPSRSRVEVRSRTSTVH